ncbi:FHA domain-containing protein At4g14490 [Coffea arabica]|uniref:FHA domain-containing protein At4g14490 n=1 Tax=Coffea arabica TaxID=13443 RepID=A0A6P6T7J4_COFAR|nr:FHA domain-containing protein At4g14490-like [Coffea arabica]XP_027073928.1 FHA domain-containing protein At4g14490-like [Coffea arabica]
MEGKAEGLSSNLRLIMEKGPLEGQTLEFIPGSKIQVGRIIRGNTIAIKDAGISTKHLAISFEDKSGNWSLSDLGSSNGTFLNGNGLEPFSSVQLSDGDAIKIGEYTSIQVEIRATVEAEEIKVRRNPTRRRAGKLGVVDESSELRFGEKNEDNENGRCQMGKGEGVLEISEVLGSKDLNEGDNEKMDNLGRKENLRRTRSKNKEGTLEDKIGVGNVGGNENVGRGEAVAKLRLRRGRRAKKEEGLGVCADTNQNVADGVEGKQVQVQSSKRITRNTRKGGNLESKEIEKVLTIPAVKDEENISVKRVTRSAVEEGNVENLEELGNKNTKKGRRGRRNLKVETPIDTVKEEIVKAVETIEIVGLEVNKDYPVEEVLEEEEGRVVDGMLVKGGRNSGMSDSGALGRLSEVKNGNSSVLDLEKMTLGDWLDYLEVHLPKQIVDDTEEMILGMRQKAEKFHEFMIQQKNSKKQG